MANRKKRLERVESGWEGGAPIIIGGPEVTDADPWQKHLAEHPEHEKAGAVI